MTMSRMTTESEGMSGDVSSENLPEEGGISYSSRQKKMKGNKSRKTRNSKRSTVRSSSVEVLQAPDSPELQPQTPPQANSMPKIASVSVDISGGVEETLDTNTIVHHHHSVSKILESLAKFQQYLFVLYTVATRLHDSLKVLLPFHSGGEDSGFDSASFPEQPTMVSGTFNKAFSEGKLSHSHSQISFDNNNSKPALIYDKEKQDTSVTITNVSSYPNPINCSDESIAPGSEDSQSRKISKRRLRFAKYFGILFALFASICMSVVTLVVKYMEGYSPVSKVVWRLQGVLFPSLVIVLYVKYYQKRPLITWKSTSTPEGDGIDRSVHWKWQIFILLVLRGLIGCAADIFQYYSLKYLPLADSTVISFSTPIFVCIVAHFMLAEKCGIVPIFTAVLTLCGVIVISKPPILTGEEEMNSTVLLGNILAILCMVSGTFTTVIMRYLQHVHFAMTMLALGIFGTIEGLVVTVFTTPFEFPDLLNHMDWILAAIIAGLFFFGQLSMTLALQREEAGVVSLVRTCDVLFAFMWQVHFLQQEANMLSYIGAIIVTSGVCITALRKWLSELPEHSPIRRRLFFILR